ncbi:MAG: YezD family protein [Verrucomicrobia bacterium]|nr:YezD family protein [Verrucomicrobiota bacterium]
MSSQTIDNKQKDPSRSRAEDAAQWIFDALQGIRFGSVEILIHEGQVVQLERRERIRLERQGRGGASD